MPEITRYRCITPSFSPSTHHRRKLMDGEQPTSTWSDFVNYCRSPSNGHKGFGRFFEAVYGPVSTPFGTAIAGWEQVSFHSVYAVSASILTIENADRVGNPKL